MQIVLLDHGLYTELDEPARRRMCRLWHAVAMRDPRRCARPPRRWACPVAALGVAAAHGAAAEPRRAVGREGARGSVRTRARQEGAAARVDGLIRGGRPPMTMDQVSEFGRALPREMMVVMRSNALIRNITRRLAADVAAHEARARGRRARSHGPRASFGLSAGGYVGRGRGAAHGPQATVGHGEVRVPRRDAAVGAGGVRVPEAGGSPRFPCARARGGTRASRASGRAYGRSGPCSTL